MNLKQRLLTKVDSKRLSDIICCDCKDILINPYTCENCYSLFCKSCLDRRVAVDKICICGRLENFNTAPKEIIDLLKS